MFVDTKSFSDKIYVFIYVFICAFALKNRNKKTKKRDKKTDFKVIVLNFAKKIAKKIKKVLTKEKRRGILIKSLVRRENKNKRQALQNRHWTLKIKQYMKKTHKKVLVKKFE